MTTPTVRNTNWAIDQEELRLRAAQRTLEIMKMPTDYRPNPIVAGTFSKFAPPPPPGHSLLVLATKGPPPKPSVAQNMLPLSKPRPSVKPKPPPYNIFTKPKPPPPKVKCTSYLRNVVARSIIKGLALPPPPRPSLPPPPRPSPESPTELGVPTHMPTPTSTAPPDSDDNWGSEWGGDGNVVTCANRSVSSPTEMPLPSVLPEPTSPPPSPLPSVLPEPTSPVDSDYVMPNCRLPRPAAVAESPTIQSGSVQEEVMIDMNPGGEICEVSRSKMANPTANRQNPAKAPPSGRIFGLPVKENPMRRPAAKPTPPGLVARVSAVLNAPSSEPSVLAAALAAVEEPRLAEQGFGCSNRSSSTSSSTSSS